MHICTCCRKSMHCTELEMLGALFSLPSAFVPYRLGMGRIWNISVKWSYPVPLQQRACVLLSPSHDDQHEGHQHCCSCSTGTYLLSVPVNSCLCWRRDVAIIIFAKGRLWFHPLCLTEVYVNHLKLAKNLRRVLWSTAVICAFPIFIGDKTFLHQDKGK